MKLVSQEFYVLENHTVQENIHDKLIGFTDEVKQKRTARLLKLLELAYLKNTRAKHLSSRQKQRVAIARALAVIPKVLLLDEPFSNLDKMLTEKLFAFIINEVRKNKTSVILITHLAEEALKYADTLAIVDNGKIVQSGEKWSVYYRPRNSRLAGLLGEYNTIRPEDFDKRSKQQFKTKIFLRPDKIVPTASKTLIDLKLYVTSCTYNGKCFEVLCESVSGRSVMVYASAPLETDREHTFMVVR
jgi:iron(III) transport system ATP-binding protein